MKIIATSLVVFFIAINSWAQSSDHLTFKGVPIDGTLSDYVAKMKQNGFTHLGTENSVALLTGDFAGNKDCNVYVATLKDKDLVSRITVLFTDRDTWSTLSGDYFNLKEMLIVKYGEPSECVEKFDTYFKPDDDGERMYEVKMDRCKYYTMYETDKGRIQLSIEHDNASSCYVALSYYDKINSEIMRAKALDDL